MRSNFRRELGILQVRLEILERGRKNIIERFREEEDCSLFVDMFKYQDNPLCLDMAMDKYLMEWFDEHWIIGKNAVANGYENDEDESILVHLLNEVMIELLKKQRFKEGQNKTRGIRRKLFQERRKYLAKLLEKDKEWKKWLSKLIYMKEKGKRLIQREIEKQKRKE